LKLPETPFKIQAVVEPLRRNPDSRLSPHFRESVTLGLEAALQRCGAGFSTWASPHSTPVWQISAQSGHRWSASRAGNCHSLHLRANPVSNRRQTSECISDENDQRPKKETQAAACASMWCNRMLVNGSTANFEHSDIGTFIWRIQYYFLLNEVVEKPIINSI